MLRVYAVDSKKEWKIFGALVGIFLIFYFLPLGNVKDSGGNI